MFINEAMETIIERKNGISLHYQVRLRLEKMIRGKKMKKDSLFPPEEKLSSEFNVSRGTIRRAISDLVNQGVLYRISGKGTFLNDGILSSQKIAILSPWNISEKNEIDQSTYESILFRGCYKSIAPAGYAIILKKFTEGQIHQLSSTREVIGLIIMNPRTSEQHLLKRLLRLSIPSIVVGADLKGIDINYIATDNTDGIQKAVDYLISLGHERIAFIGAAPEEFDTQDRFEAFDKICKTKKISRSSNIIIQGEDWKKGVDEIFSEWQRKNFFPSAVIAGGFEIALMVMEAAHNFSKKIPDDISLVGFDDFLTASYLSPPLTTICQPLYEIAKEAVEFLLKKVNSFDKQNVRLQKLFPTQLIVRSSCRKIQSSGIRGMP